MAVLPKLTKKTTCFTQIQLQFYSKQTTDCKDYTQTKIN